MTNTHSATSSTPILSSYADDPDYRELIEFFVMGMPDKIAEFEEALESRNVPFLKVLAHQLKGSGGGYGFQAISQVASALEEACKADDMTQIEETCRTVIADLHRVSA